MSPSQLHLNLLAERAKDCTISRAVTGTEITLEASVAGGLADMVPAADAASSLVVSEMRSLQAGGELISVVGRRPAWPEPLNSQDTEVCREWNLRGVSMRGSVIIAGTALGALVAAGCSSSTTASGGASKMCVATIGMEGPLTGPLAGLGQEQLDFAQLALAMDNLADKTKISLVQGDTQLNPAQATTVTQQFTSNPKIVAVVGPAGSQEVEAVGPLIARAGLAFISGSATAAALTTGKYPTFFRVVPNDSVQGPQDANYIVKNLHPKALMIIDDQEAYSTGLVAAMVPIFQAAGITVDHESVSQKTTDFSSLVAKVTPAMSVVVLPWQIAANAQQFGRDLAHEHKKAVIFGTDGLFSPSVFTISGSYVSSFGTDINSAGKYRPIPG
jgi:branched-chain amino acid transport system substrate-binding protein